MGKNTTSKENIRNTADNDNTTHNNSTIKEAEMKTAELMKVNTKLLKENKKEMKKTIRNAEEKMREEMDDRERITNKYTEEINKITEEITKQNEERRTYAGVLVSSPRGGKESALTTHTVVVTSQDSMETGEQVLERIRTAVNAKEEGIRIDRIRKRKDRKIIIGCESKKEIGKVKEKIERSGTNLTVEQVANKDPLIIF